MMYQYVVVAVGACDGQPAIWFSANQGLNFTQYDGLDSYFGFIPNAVMLNDNDNEFIVTGDAGLNNVVPYAYATLSNGQSCGNATAAYACSTNFSTCVRGAAGNLTQMCQCTAGKFVFT
jgi:hypothetical protein